MSSEKPRLVVGPLLRYAGTESATFWVETSAPCEVEVLGERAKTFAVEGHHYALVVHESLEPGSVTSYDVRLDGEVVWPEPSDDRPAPVVRTREWEHRVRLVFGSCRLGALEPPTAPSPWPEEVERTGIDALWAYSKSLQRGEVPWPDALVLLGDQVYADDVPDATAAYIRLRRDTREAPGEEVADFEEYTQLYRDSWSDPDIRWLLSTVPSVMIFDDHDVNDDWNISWSWVEEMRATGWWDARITGAFMSYWIYQHLGNLSPPELAEEEMFHHVRHDEDAGERLRTFARMCDRESAACRWAFYRDFGDSRILVLDSRAARVLADERRDMIDEDEWDWVVEHSRGTFDHLVIASTVPVFMAHGLHHLEAWNEALCNGRWGRRLARFGEKLRRGVDLEHWAAFNGSFERLCDWLRTVAEGVDGRRAPASVVLLGGDVHHVYVADVDLGTDAAGTSRIFQLVCSPFRNPLSGTELRTVRVTGSRVSGAVFALLSRLAGVPPASAKWKLVRGPTFVNSIGELELDGRAAKVTMRRSAGDGEQIDRLYDLHELTLAGEDAGGASTSQTKGALDAATA